MTAFIDGLVSVIVGNSAATTAQFIVPSEFVSLGSGYITYSLIDADGVVYSTGTGTSYTVTPISTGNRVTADFTITVPSDAPVSEIGSQYQVKFDLVLPDEENQVFTVYDTLHVLPSAKVNLGAEDSIELYGTTTQLKLVTEFTADADPTCQLYMQNEEINTPITASGPINLSDGYEYVVSVNTAANNIQPLLVPYNLVWTYAVSGQTQHESSNLFIVTPSLLQAIKDILLVVNKARGQMRDNPIYDEGEIMSYLRQGADMFNAMFNPTNFTMTNATGPVRYLWLQCSAIIALRAQYLMEGESAFNFSGQAISLDVDRSQFYESQASSIESGISEPLRNLKQNLAKRGLVQGDGNVNPLALARNAIGTIGITASPVSNMRTTGKDGWRYGPRFGW